MRKTTMGVCLAALIVSCSMNSGLQAGELLIRDNFFIADDARHQSVNELNDHTGRLIVSGALLSSPCNLDTNEVTLSRQAGKATSHYILRLNLVECGYGGRITSSISPAGRDDTMVVDSTLIAEGGNGSRYPDLQVLSKGKRILYSGMNQLTYYLNDSQQQALTGQQQSNYTQNNLFGNTRGNNTLLRLRLDYE